MAPEASESQLWGRLWKPGLGLQTKKHSQNNETLQYLEWLITNSCTLTTLSHLTDVHSLFRSHEAQNREHNEASKKTGSTVDHCQDKSIPTEKWKKKKKKTRIQKLKRKKVGKTHWTIWCNLGLCNILKTDPDKEEMDSDGKLGINSNFLKDETFLVGR